MPGATITLTNLDTGIGTARITDADGTYEFVTVRAGRYEIAARASGILHGNPLRMCRVAVGARQRVELQLRPGNLTETVEVVGAATRLETDSSQRGQVR